MYAGFVFARSCCVLSLSLFGVLPGILCVWNLFAAAIMCGAGFFSLFFRLLFCLSYGTRRRVSGLFGVRIARIDYAAVSDAFGFAGIS